jgi:hypothetical protein
VEAEAAAASCWSADSMAREASLEPRDCFAAAPLWLCLLPWPGSTSHKEMIIFISHSQSRAQPPPLPRDNDLG